MPAPVSSSLTFDFINTSIANVVRSKETSLQNEIAGLGDSPSTGQLLAVQAQSFQWTMEVQLQSTMMKEISDALKGIIQKAG